MFKFQKLVEKVAKATPNAQLPTALHMLVFPGAHIPSFCLKHFHSRHLVGRVIPTTQPIFQQKLMNCYTLLRYAHKLLISINHVHM